MARRVSPAIRTGCGARGTHVEIAGRVDGRDIRSDHTRIGPKTSTVSTVSLLCKCFTATSTEADEWATMAAEATDLERTYDDDAADT